MAIPKLQISDPRKGLPKQRVPLRYAVLVTGLKVPDFTAMLANVWDEGDGKLHEILAAREFSNGENRPCRPALFKELLTVMKGLPTPKEQMKLLPPNWYVDSTDLAIAFSKYIELTVGRESGDDHDDMYLNWNPAFSGFESLIKSCIPILTGSGELPQREVRRQNTDARNQSWYSQYLEMKNQFPSKFDTDIAASIAKKDGNATAKTVRRIISTMKKS